MDEVKLPEDQKIVVPEATAPTSDPRKNAAWKHKELQPLRFYLKMFRLTSPKLNVSRMAGKLTHATKTKGKGESKAARKQAASSRKINRK